MIRGNSTAFEPDRRFDSLTEAFAFILGQYQLQPNDCSWTELSSGLVVPDEAPRYLFRGECGGFPDTVSSARRPSTYAARVGGRPSPFPVQELLQLADALIWRFQQPDYGLDRGSAVGLLQHYGFPTTAIDFTGHLGYAFAFAAEKTSPVGRVAVMPYSSSGVAARVINWTEHGWAERPRRQAAFGLIMAAGLTDLKSEAVRSRLNVKWYQFPVSPSDKDYLGGMYHELVKTSDDSSAGFLRHLITEYVEARGKLSPALTEWLLERVPIAPHCYLVRSFEGNEVIVNYRGSNALEAFNEEAEIKHTRRYWSSESPERSWERMRNWVWPPVGQIVADPRTYHPEP
jgi:hypothetical protein